ncbi:MAG: hypothetical protein ACREVI_01470 [Steroidobacteraceae bacterium]
MTATRDGRVRSTLTRGREPAAVAADQRTASPATRAPVASGSRRGTGAAAPAAPRAPTRIASDSGAGGDSAARSSAQREVAAGSQNNASRSSYRAPASTLRRPN